MHNLKSRIIDALADETTFFEQALVTPAALNDLIDFVKHHDDFRNEPVEAIEAACASIIDEALS